MQLLPQKCFIPFVQFGELVHGELLALSGEDEAALRKNLGDKGKRQIVPIHLLGDVVEQMIKASTLEDPSQALNKVKILGYSQVPSFPREARKGFKFLVAVILSGIAAFVAGLFVDGLNHSIRKREEIEEQLNVPYLASLGSHLR